MEVYLAVVYDIRIVLEACPKVWRSSFNYDNSWLFGGIASLA
jgi:hypothetical protein